MAKIYEGGIKLTTVQVIGSLASDMPESHRAIMRDRIANQQITNNSEKMFSHAILDAYQYLPTENEVEEKSKKYCKYLMERYMKSTIKDKELPSAYDNLIQSIRG